jgi:Mg2+-importing ATPase
VSYWAQPVEEVAAGLGVGTAGLTSAQAAQRLEKFGPNELRARRGSSRLHVLWRQVRSPLVLLLVFAAVASAASGEWMDGGIVGAILAASVGIGYQREYRAEPAIGALIARVQLTAEAVRDGRPRTISAREVVPGDVVMLGPGSIVPGDAVLLDTTELHVDDAVLTGESFPMVKRPGHVAETAALRERTGCVQMGTNVRSGTATALVVATGAHTVFGTIAKRLETRAPETEFERGLRRFGLLLLVAMLVMIVVVFAVNVIFGRPAIDTLLFSIALAVGLSPELLPAIVGVNLSRAAQQLSGEGVLVRRLDALEDLGSMDVLCTDKTGTLTEGVVRVAGAYDTAGADSARVRDLAVLNAVLQTGLANPIDEALAQGATFDRASVTKLAEVPYDFTRKRLSVIVKRGDTVELVMKGAFNHVLEVCTGLDDAARAAAVEHYRAWSADGIRVIAVATRTLEPRPHYSFEDEHDLQLAGYVTFFDRPKEDAITALASLHRLGVRVKMITGDSRLVAHHVATEVKLGGQKVLVGEDIHDLTEVGLVRAVQDTDVFAEVDPNQKERILRALRKGGAVVGFFGDGVNDAPAMHAADVSISVETAVDVAKATADLVLTRKGLDVIRSGIEHGRTTFANTLKYVLTTTSANFGNMISMAVAPLILPFLPLTAGQVLLNNFLSDVPAVGIASDRVDPELVARPRRWSTRFIGRFMLEFGLLSSLFDAATFAVLLLGFGATAQVFRTGWFVESLFTELVIALVVRTRRPAWRSRPGRTLVVTTVAVATVAFVLPYLPFIGVLGFTQPPALLMLAIVLITFCYVAASELLKQWFYRGVA